MLLLESELNHNSLLNWTLIEKYEKVNNSSFIEDFKKLLILKPKQFQQKKAAQTILKNKLQKVMDKAELDKMRLIQNKLLFSHRKTDNSRFFKSFLLKDQNCHTQVQKIREKLQKAIRKNQEVQEKELAFILPFLDYFGISTIDFDLSKQKDRQTLKSCLTCLKKMMGNQQNTSNKQKLMERNNCYKLNLDLRYAFSKASQLISDEEIKIQLLKVLSSSKNKKWLGIRFSRCLTSACWTSQALRMLLSALTRTRIQQDEIQTNIDTFYSIFQKLRKNVKDLMFQVKRSQRKTAKHLSEPKAQSQSIYVEEPIVSILQNQDNQSNKDLDSTIKGISMIDELYQLYSQQLQP